MCELENESVDLVVTSPPYWNIKDYGIQSQIGHDQTLHQYLESLFMVWSETWRVLRPGSRMCINVGDQFLRAADYGRYRVLPLHSEITGQCIQIGFDYMGSVIWQKKTTVNTTGGANVMGSYPYPRNGILELDYEYILIFRKAGRALPAKESKEKSALTKDEWKEYFSGHWNFGGERQANHKAMFPVELPKRLIRMYSFEGDTVLDPFLGSGTTARAAASCGRNCTGYEINSLYSEMIEKKLAHEISENTVRLTFEDAKDRKGCRKPSGKYSPFLPDLHPSGYGSAGRTGPETVKVLEIVDGSTIRLADGRLVSFEGIRITDNESAISYMSEYVRGKMIFLKSVRTIDESRIGAKVYLKNRIFINRELVRRGAASETLQ